jgi:hypothetical protein
MEYILSIDIGIINLGYVFCSLGSSTTTSIKKSTYFLDEYFPINVISCNRTNITNIKHSIIKFCDCKLHHDYCIPDYLDHFIQENIQMFEQAAIILLERQPPMGVTNVQDLLFTKFRDKVVLINPGSVHKYFSMSKDYSTRKLQSEKIATRYLCSFHEFNNNSRKHDMSDAMLMIMYYYSQQKNNIKKPVPQILDFEQFRMK